MHAHNVYNMGTIIYSMSTNLMKLKTVRISDDLHTELTKIGGYNETMDDIIRKCVRAYKDSHQKK